MYMYVDLSASLLLIRLTPHHGDWSATCYLLWLSDELHAPSFDISNMIIKRTCTSANMMNIQLPVWSMTSK